MTFADYFKNPIVQSITAALLWAWLMASSFVVSAYVTSYASPFATTGLRFIMALVLMTPIYFWLPKRPEDSLGAVLSSRSLTMKYLLISGALVGFFIGLFSALKTTSSLNTSVMYTLVPLLGAILMLSFGQRTSYKHWLGYMVGSAGAISVLVFTREGTLSWHVGDGIYFFACGLLALHIISVQHWSKTVAAFTGAYRIMFFGSLWLIPITLIWGDLGSVAWQSSEFWLLLLYLTLFTTLLTFVLQQLVIRFGGASRLLAFSYTIPIWVALYQASQGQDILLYSYGFMIGCGMVLLALFMIDSQPNKTSEPCDG
ncbi:DMT family transporter [Marinomonas ostreistagni]|uniref:DMT family transporter n=1 Tax=Marinomonas ostreistagni TaxID=359209 RepID=UPI0019500747|nr:DMT family transporter [Marinomonas ostreistagni]MBM6552129.1 DMT family transporter [Marinomonas ostreistagni]